MKNSEIRQKFTDYFKRQGHAHVPSSSLIPENDPTLLFANAGMNQFKNLFLGLEHRNYNKAVSIQKCVRAGGKHNDLENVGFTARHHTFFEMLGNFSFGDYFKKEAIHFAWELLTKDYGIPKDKLYVTVFQNDDDAANIWHKQEGVPLDRIFRLGEKDNFWRMGDTGPCGPCSEIFYDHGPRAGKESDPYKGIISGEDRFIEIWNLVFMQFFEKSPGQMESLPRPSVDTGAGLERLTAVLQGKLNNYDTDLFWPMIVRASEISRKTELLDQIQKFDKDGYKASISSDIRNQIVCLRVVADHTRSASFLIADGALPSNEGRGYVLRRILRRAIRFAQNLSGKESFLPQISEVLIDEMGAAYPELKERQNIILTTLKDEQDRFMVTLETGTEILNEELKKLISRNKTEVPGEIVFKLYDTYGFPVDLTRLMAQEKNFTINENDFNQEMENAREKAKVSWKGKGISSDESHLITLTQEVFDIYKATHFFGYDKTSGESKILFISNGTNKVFSLKTGESGFVILDKTPFYAESGGQVSDLGILTTKNVLVKVHNCTKNHDVFVHHVKVERGEIKVDENILCQVDSTERQNTTCNHSATHLLHSALRKVLGLHVTQSGQKVDAYRIRFDFTHNKPVSTEEIQKLENLINAEISKSTTVDCQIMKYKEALTVGATALFGEKYGDDVRVVKMGDFSSELCGGTHVHNSAQIRIFKIVSESGMSAGVRRIEAITGDIALQYAMKNINENQRARSAAGLNESWTHYLETKKEIVDWIEEKKTEIRDLHREIKKIQGSKIDLDNLLSKAKSFNSKSGPAKLVMADLDLDDREVLAQITDQIKNKIQKGIVLVIGHGDSSHPVIVSVSKDLNPDISAGNLLKELAQIMGGKGGGRPDFAQGAVPDRNKITEAFALAEKILKI